jgi:two-component system response regulator LytT
LEKPQFQSGGQGPKPRAQSLRMSLTAVVVDDEQLAREELCYMLEQMGSIEIVAQAGNGLEAVGIVERFTPDVVFLDVQMPGLNGFEVAHRLIQHGTSPKRSK